MSKPPIQNIEQKSNERIENLLGEAFQPIHSPKEERHWCSDNCDNCPKEKECFSSVSLDSSPEQYKCDSCGKKWTADDKTPVCGDSPKEEKCMCHAHYDSLERRADGEKIKIAPKDPDCKACFFSPTWEEKKCWCGNAFGNCPKNCSPTWEETTAQAIENDIHEILESRGIYDGGKNFLEDVEKHIMPRLKAIREEGYKEGIKMMSTDELNTIQDYARSAALKEVQEMVEEKLPMHWFPEGALHLKRKYLEEILSLLQTLENKEL